ncbi:hypothetical protein [Candidatus Amarolinea aalborgensis]|uniref:hypothetical protein n=1 Tax=Candidatus Amarolinea aalborgensis TaxID=2249329 RepID=UPI003BF9D4C5
MNRRYPMAGRLHMMQSAWRLVLVLLTAVWLPGCSSQAAPIVIQWSTETEVNTAGFNVFRSDSRDGQYVQINAELVPSSPDPLLGGRYAYTDAQVEAGKTYFYKLEELESTGNRITYDRIVEATAYAQGFLGLSYTVWVVFIAALVILMGVSAFVRRRQHPSA